MDQEMQLRYPTGKFENKNQYDMAEIKSFISAIKNLPISFSTQARVLSVEQLNSPYRPGGWTGRQVIHHVADSHLNAYIRTKWVLTEDNPTIKTYDENAWAQTPEIEKTPIEVSLKLISAIHQRWSDLLDACGESEFQRMLYHPEQKRALTLSQLLALYAWHGSHHTGHLKILASI